MSVNARNYIFTSERIGFGVWREEDIELAFEIWGDAGITKFVGGPFTREQVRARILLEMANYEKYKIQYWPMFLLSNGEHIGCCGLKPYGSGGNILETGFYLKQKYQGAGYAREASSAVIRYAFDTLGVNGLFAGHHPKNEASKGLLGKLGFRCTGVEFYEPSGLDHPSYMLSREDYLEIYCGEARRD